jgi:hypothetical protein
VKSLRIQQDQNNMAPKEVGMYLEKALDIARRDGRSF